MSTPSSLTDFQQRSADTATRAWGFTLIEVMIVVAIVAILAAVALPAYTDYIRRGNLPEAFTALSDYRIKMEQYYQDHRNYGSGTACADGAPAPTWNTFAPGAKHFSFQCATDGQTYTVTATGSTGSNVSGHVYTIDQDNRQQTTQFKGGTVSKSCWLSKGNEC
jgi:prepilin-type N-terminal cleavage/methylation domain-containing protein